MNSTATIPTSSEAGTPERLSSTTKLLYGAPALAGGAMVIPLLINMPKFYADVVAVPLGYLAVAIAVTRCLDAIIDPSIGLISDHTHSRWGRRRPYIFIGAPLGGLAFWALMSPPAHLTGFGGVVWFSAFSILCSLFLTIALLPHHALGAELSMDYNERNSLFGARESFGVLGTIIAAAAPGFLMHRFKWGEREVFSRLALAFTMALVALCWLMVAFVRERPDFVARQSNPLVPGIRRALRNRPFIILLSSYVAASVGGGIAPILMPFFIAYVLQPVQPMLWLSIVMLVFFGTGLLFIPFGVVLARHFGKLPTLIACYVAGISGGIMTFSFVGKGDTTLLLILVGFGATSYGASVFLPASMQAEVIDYDELHTGLRREAQYAGFWSILPKLAAIPAAAIPLALLATLGYAPNGVQTPQVISTIRLLYTLGPCFTALVSLAIVCWFPINRVNHAAILDGVQRHKRGLNATDPLTGRDIPPPGARGADEATGWFLDNFSQRELRRFLARGSQTPPWGVRRAATFWIAVCVIAGWFALRRMGAINADPGAAASLAVVLSGFALALFLFHLTRIGPARRLASGVISNAVVRAHMADCRQGSI
ncbi:MAG TPA: MFS transporter [Candidatus Binataceae bacterium]|nr:MFS transporter [Candidatus Binataceae bacterium]